MRLVGQAFRAVTRLAAVAGAVWWLFAVTGPWVVAAVAGAALTLGALAAWASWVEPWLFAPRFPDGDDFVVHLTPPPGVEVDHLAFARALSAVADAYVDECVRQAAAELDEDGFL
jgi:hypothetical protein